MIKKVRKPILVGNDSDTIVSLQIASVRVNGVPTTPEVCILFEDGEDNATAAFFTPEQIDMLVTKLETLKHQIRWKR
jgi:hypothetical protein